MHVWRHPGKATLRCMLQKNYMCILQPNYWNLFITRLLLFPYSYCEKWQYEYHTRNRTFWMRFYTKWSTTGQIFSWCLNIKPFDNHTCFNHSSNVLYIQKILLNFWSIGNRHLKFDPRLDHIFTKRIKRGGGT